MYTTGFESGAKRVAENEHGAHSNLAQTAKRGDRLSRMLDVASIVKDPLSELCFSNASFMSLRLVSLSVRPSFDLNQGTRRRGGQGRAIFAGRGVTVGVLRVHGCSKGAPVLGGLRRRRWKYWGRGRGGFGGVRRSW